MVSVNSATVIKLYFTSLEGDSVHFVGVADLRYERLNMPVIETSIDKAWGFLTYFFHTLVIV
ncbi:MAG: hypothetical protein JGK30_27205 [Microcoleus sp. PH2017_40_RAT_O_B]|uniref:hypothetical protein n=1 Tax=Microcoleus sp. PH2017_40_RAT_O_B TaxID=2798850 RepID=UPI001D50245D|nr:hypothetical protein [Microcoleus sp. PH2017_40_RAT_O_B]MCC3613060.1 hypothetical protein [Microcoleus sp. PH2017_40_RAT_O_B]